MNCDRPSERQAEEQKYLVQDKSVVSAGPLGIVGQVGEYLRSYLRIQSRSILDIVE